MVRLSRTGKKILLAVAAFIIMLALGLSCMYTPLQVAVAASSSSVTKYYTDYDSLDDALAAAEQMTEDTAEEGDILLKNRNNALPLSGSEWVSVFGVSADELIGAASTSGTSTASGGGDTVAEVLENAGFNVNPTLASYYDNQSATIGSEDTTFNGKVVSSLSVYSDVAVVLLARTGAEMSDCDTIINEAAGTSLLGEEDSDTHAALGTSNGTEMKHYLMLTDSERELLELAKSKCEKVVVVLNTSQAMEVEELRDDDGIDAIINIDRPGEGGLAALASILKGDVNPSGGLVDEWNTDFTADPTWYNVIDNSQTADLGAGDNTYMNEAGNADGTYTDDDGNTVDVIGDSGGYHGVDYEEGIYLGYRFYETYYYDMYDIDADAAQEWWDENVTYPFGYGLSYTTFSYETDGIYSDEDLTDKLTGDLSEAFASTVSEAAEVETVYIPVTVTNTGDVAGKKTVQVYVTAPYSDDSLTEKAAVSLVGFVKTDTIKPGASQTVTVPVNVQDMASWYSYQVQSDETSGAYILEAGEYTLRIMEDSHYDRSTTLADDGSYYVTDSEGTKAVECYAEETFSIDTLTVLEQDDYSGLQVSSLFTDGLNSNGDGMDGDSAVTDSNFGNVRTADMMADDESGMTTMTRNSTITSADTASYTGTSVPSTGDSGVSKTVNGFDLSFPVAPQTEDLTFKNNVLFNWSYWDNYAASSAYEGYNDSYELFNEYYANDDDAGYVWSQTSVPDGWSQVKGTLGLYAITGGDAERSSETNTYYKYASSKEDNTLMFADMCGLDYDDEAWDTFLNQLTYDELCQVNTFCGYGTVNIDSVEKAGTSDKDGPNSINSTFQCTSESLLAATWNTEIAELRGIIIGNICLLTGIQGWYGVGADMHRSPFSGRNNEYYAQDGYLGGVIGAAQTQGVQSKGVICYVKHTLMNDQETDRACLFAWCDEQAMREVYIKTFQMIFQEGETKAAMTAYGRISGKSNTNNTNLSVELYQNEWGSNAYLVTDGYTDWNQRTNPDIMVRAGAQTILKSDRFEHLSGQTDIDDGSQPTGGFYLEGELLPDGNYATEDGVYLVETDDEGNTVYELSYTQWYCVREMAHSVLYQVANSCGQYNGYSSLDIESETLVATESVSASDLTVSISSYIDDDSSATYAISDGELPDGLTLDETTGEISGTPTETGTFEFTVTYTIDGWIEGSVTYTLVVDTAIYVTAESDSLETAEVGTEFYAELTSDVYTSAEYSSLEYSLADGSELPDGLELSTDGVLSGTPTTAGTYTFTVVLTATSESSSGGGWGTYPAVSTYGSGWGGGTTTYTCETTFTIIVLGEEADDDDGDELTIEDLEEEIAALEDELEESISSLEESISSIESSVSTLSESISSDGESSGNGLAVAGLVVGIVAIVGVLACAAYVVIVARKK